MKDEDVKAVLTVRTQPLGGTIANRYALPFRSVEKAWEELRKWIGPETIYIELRDTDTGAVYSWSGGARR